MVVKPRTCAPAGCLLLAALAVWACGRTVEPGEPAPETGTPGPASMSGVDPIALFLCGDVMTGRGIDQVLPHPSDPVLYEPYVQDARDYVALAERANGPIQAPVRYATIWGDALQEWARLGPDVRLINLETSVTASDARWEGKGIHYRMHPQNVPCLAAAQIDVCALANNHLLDWGYAGLEETLETLADAGLHTVGAGRTLDEAAAPAVIEVEGKGRVIVLAYGLPSSGIPFAWSAARDSPGINLLMDLSAGAVQRVKQGVEAVKGPGDVVVVSIHWGSNWGYDIPEEQTAFAHQLIDEAHVDVVHGHSSHHVKGIEVYQGRPILYGAGDFLNDYEGIGGDEGYRGDLALMYFLSVDPSTGRLVGLRMVPMQVRNFRLNRASDADVRWLEDTLNREGKQLGTWVEVAQDGTLTLNWE